MNSGSVSTAASDCSFPCPGDASQSCGAGDRLNVYQVTGSNPEEEEVDFSKYGDRGCYTEATTGRALSGKTTRTDDMTIAKCASICAAEEFSLFGVEYFNEVCRANLDEVVSSQD